MESNDIVRQALEHKLNRKLAQTIYDRKTDFTDSGRANMLHQIVSTTLRYVVDRNQWLMWLDGRWHVDDHETFVNSRALQVAYQYEEAAQSARNTGNGDLAKAFDKEARQCRNRSTLENMIRGLALKIGVPIRTQELDHNPWLLGVANGVVDLRTGELRTRESESDFVTKRCTVPYTRAEAPRWEQFIAEVTGTQGATPDEFVPRPALARYLQKMLGYCCTGSPQEQKFFIALGEGSNGKNILFEAVGRVLGDYAATLPADVLMATKFAADAERPTSMAASLEGARFVMSSEVKDGQRLDVGLVKNHTGDSKMTARRMRENARTFEITHKVVLLTNVKPGMDHLDAAIRGRLHLIPFDRVWNRPGVERNPALPDGDKGLKETLKAEAEGILSWLVHGAVMYQDEGLEPPPEVLAQTHAFMLEQDHLGRWIAETCERCSAEAGTLAGTLLGHFATWCLAEGVANPYLTPKAFSNALNARQVSGTRTMHGAKRGLRILPELEEASTGEADPLS